LFVFPKLKSVLKERLLESVKDIKEYSLAQLRGISKDALQECFQNWKKCCEQCIKSVGRGVPEREKKSQQLQSQ
jgi:hypothetical protein